MHNIFSTILGLCPYLIACGYYVYISEHLTPAERILLSVKDKAYMYITMLGLALLDLIALIFLAKLMYLNSFTSFLICIITIVNILLLFVFVMFMNSHHPIDVYLIINMSKYKLLNRIDDSHISVRSRNGDEHEILIFNISKIENHILKEEYHSQKAKNENWIVAIVFGVMTSLSAMMIIISIRSSISILWLVIICFIVALLSAVFMYCKNSEKK